MNAPVWPDIESISREFGFSPELSPDDVRKELRRLLFQLRPDPADAHFDTPDLEERFNRALAALHAVTALEESRYPLVRVEDAPGPAVTVATLARKIDESTVSRLVSESRGAVRRKYAVPKITSALVATVLPLIFSFLNRLEEHPFYPLASSLVSKEEMIDSGFQVSISSISREIRVMDRQADIHDVDSYIDATELGEGLPDRAMPIPAQFAALDSVLARARGRHTALEDSARSYFRHRDGIDSLARAANLRGDSILLVSVIENAELNASRAAVFRSMADVYKSAVPLSRRLKTLAIQYRAEMRRNQRNVQRLVFHLGWSIWLSAAILFLVLWKREKAEEDRIDFVTTDGALNAVFSGLRKTLHDRGLTAFDLRDLTNVVRDLDSIRPLPLSKRLGLGESEKLAHLVAEALVSRGVIQKNPGIPTTYALR